jgi:hypothetical protein
MNGPPPKIMTCPKCKVKGAAHRHCDAKGCRYGYCEPCQIFFLIRAKPTQTLLGTTVRWVSVKWWDEKPQEVEDVDGS